MNRLDLRKIIKEEIQDVLSENEIDYTDRNSGLLDAARKLLKIQIELEGFDISNAAPKALASNKNTRLGPVSADWDEAAEKVLDFIKFLSKYDGA